MKALNAVRRIGRRLLRRASPLSPQGKRAGELAFWRSEIDTYVRWLTGERLDLYGITPPAAHEIIPADTLALSAILTWIRKDAGKYLRHLGVPAGIFRGKRLLEVGCGPLPYALCFTECSIIALDPLLSLYLEAGYPMHSYSHRLHYICAAGEDIPLAPASVDAVLSVNAIDHVDDLRQVAREINRALTPDGLILIEAHYHDPRPLEPLAIDDAVMADLFRTRRLRKVAERTFTQLYPMYPDRRDERLAVWTNRPETLCE